MRELHIFLDSNILMHYRSPEEVDWPKEFEADRILLLLAPQVVRELDKLKASENRRIKRRARRAVEKVSRLLAEDNHASIRQNVELRYLHQEPEIVFENEGLRETVPDDRILGSVLEYRDRIPGVDIRLITADTNLRLKARARGISTTTLDDSYKLAPEPDPLEKENRELKKELRRLKSREPCLELQFAATRRNWIKVHVRPFKALTDQQILNRLDAEKKAYPLIQWPPEDRLIKKPTDTTELESSGRVVTKFHEIAVAAVSVQGDEMLLTEEQVEDYNKRIGEYYEKCKDFIEEVHRYEHEKLLLCDLKLNLVNSGSYPAEGIDVEIIREPPGCLLCHDADAVLPQMPTKPEPPGSPGEERTSRIVSRGGFALTRGSGIEHLKEAINPPNVTTFSSGSDVKHTVRKLKHGTNASLPLIVRFRAYEAAESLSLRVILTADNIPDKQECDLHIKVMTDGPEESP